MKSNIPIHLLHTKTKFILFSLLPKNHFTKKWLGIKEIRSTLEVDWRIYFFLRESSPKLVRSDPRAWTTLPLTCIESSARQEVRARRNWDTAQARKRTPTAFLPWIMQSGPFSQGCAMINTQQNYQKVGCHSKQDSKHLSLKLSSNITNTQQCLVMDL